VDFKKTGKELAAIVLIAIAPAALFNLGLIRRQLRGDFDESLILPAGTPGVAFIGLAEAGDLFQGGAALFVDSRTVDQYADGHVPGAASVPLKEASENIVLATPKALDVAPTRTLVVYCNGGDCQTSVLLTRILREAGFTDIKIFLGGWAEWQAAGFPAEVGRDPK
jgi:rhodanese-related sulfurtransferase